MLASGNDSQQKLHMMGVPILSPPLFAPAAFCRLTARQRREDHSPFLASFLGGATAAITAASL